MGSTSLRSAASRSSFLLTRRRPQPKQPQHMFGWLSKTPLGCDLTVSASWPSSLPAAQLENCDLNYCFLQSKNLSGPSAAEPFRPHIVLYSAVRYLHDYDC